MPDATIRLELRLLESWEPGCIAAQPADFAGVFVGKEFTPV